MNSIVMWIGNVLINVAMWVGIVVACGYMSNDDNMTAVLIVGAIVSVATSIIAATSVIAICQSSPSPSRR